MYNLDDHLKILYSTQHTATTPDCQVTILVQLQQVMSDSLYGPCLQGTKAHVHP